MLKTTLLIMLGCLLSLTSFSQKEKGGNETAMADSTNKSGKGTYYGTASFYAEKFNGRQTANGETYDGKKYTAACNVLPLGTWIRVTNIRNKKTVIVKVNDRLHPKMKRIVDLSRVAAEKLGYIGRGLTQVKVEVLGKRKPE
jgi:rare lipoprotein A